MDFIEILKMILPAVLVLVATILILKNQNEVALENVRLELRKAQSNTFSPLKLQAYERFALFLERNSITNLIAEFNNPDISVFAFKHSMLQTIQNEFKHNVSQQIYISAQAYTIIKISKEETTQWIQQAAEGLDTKAPSTELATKLIELAKEKGYIPTDKALNFIKSEVSLYFQ